MSVLVETSDRALTAEQQEAVARRTGSLLLAAGAGSGKTSVLVERFVAAVRDDGIAPSRILAITFTERAAGELRSRLRARLAALGERAAVAELERSEIGTVHGFCARLLRAHAPAAGLDPRFAVLDEPRADHLRTLAFREALTGFVGLGGGHARDGAVELVAAYGADRLRTAVATVYDELRSRGEAAPELPVLHDDDQAALAAWGLFGALLEGYGGAYERLKRARAVVDFDDLELRARDLLRHDAGVRAAWSERLQMLMVDELQDINPRQLELLEALEQDNLFTVGDELQSIYGFRHADVGLFRARRAALAAHGASLALTANFRSAPAVLEVVNAVFAPLLGAAYTPLRAGREDAAAEAAAGGPVCELLLTDTIGWDGLAAGDVGAGLPPVAAWRAAEARLLAQRLDDLIGSGAARPRDVAVLMRASSDLPAYERALQDRGLPTIAAGAGGYWSGQQVGDLLAYLRTLANPLDELALYSLLASPLIGVSSDGLALLARAAREAGCDTWSLLGGEQLPALPERDAERLRAIWPWLLAERAAATRHPASELLVRMLRRTGYEAYLCSLRSGERRLANVHKLLRLARAFEAQEGIDMRAFCDHAARQTQAQAREADAPVDDGDRDAVTLMTIHAAKGLEFPVVAVADLGRRGRNDVPDLLVSGPPAPGGGGLRLVGLDGSSVPALEYERLRSERLEAGAAEELRVMYVAMTRARERLILSGAVNVARWPASSPGAPPIGWLAPALVEGLTELVTDEQPLADGHPPGAPQARVRVSLNSPATFGRVLRELAGAREHTPAPAPAPEPGGGYRMSGIPERSVPTPSAAEPPPAPVAPPPPDSLSYTALREYERCGYRYYLERVLGLSEDEAPPAAGTAARPGTLDPRTRGALLHRLIEVASPFAGGPGAEQAAARVARELGADPEPAELREICAVLAALATTALGARLAAAPRLVREHAFSLSLGRERPLLNGVVDAMVNELDGTCLVVDYKSDQARGANLAELTEREYGIQRRVYALAALRAGAARVEVVHWFLERPEEPVAAIFTADAQESLAQSLWQLVDGVTAGEFAVTGVPHAALCHDCPGRRALCSYDEELTLAASPPQAQLGA